METVMTLIAGVTLIALVGVLILAYVLWRDRRRVEDAKAEALAEFARGPDASPLGGGGGPRPKK